MINNVVFKMGNQESSILRSRLLGSLYSKSQKNSHIIWYINRETLSKWGILEVQKSTEGKYLFALRDSSGSPIFSNLIPAWDENELILRYQDENWVLNLSLALEDQEISGELMVRKTNSFGNPIPIRLTGV